MDLNKLKRGVPLGPTEYDHLKGRLDTDAFLEDLGIEVSYRSKAHQIMCHCPNLTGNHLRGDQNPSFGFNEELLAFNCLAGCYKGNILELVKLMRPGMDDEDALAYAEQFADLNSANGVSLEDKVKTILNPPTEEDELPDYPPDSLFQYRKIHSYLYDRGLTKDVIVDMQVGYDEEHEGITIPHFFMGKLVGMQRRHLVEDEHGYRCPRCELDPKHDVSKGKKVPKYKNTARFPKVNTLYGYDRMKQKMREEGFDWVIVVESPFTALYLMSLGFNNVVASFGSWSPEQAMLLIAVPYVYFWPDNDAAGLENCKKAIDSLGRYVSLKIVPVVDGIKSDAANLKSAGMVQAYLDHAFPSALTGIHGYTPTLREVL